MRGPWGLTAPFDTPSAGAVLALVVVLGGFAVAGGGAVALGGIDVGGIVGDVTDSAFTGGSDIEGVDRSGDQLVVQLSEDRDLDVVVVRHETATPASQSGFLQRTGEDDPSVRELSPGVGDSVTLGLTGSSATPGVLCEAGATATGGDTAATFPSTEFVVAGVERSTYWAEEVETVSVELDPDEYTCPS
jgi:hypothetical protein